MNFSPSAQPSWRRSFLSQRRVFCGGVATGLAVMATDAAIVDATQVAKLKTPKLITEVATMAATEASHATAIRTAFIELGTAVSCLAQRQYS